MLEDLSDEEDEIPKPRRPIDWDEDEEDDDDDDGEGGDDDNDGDENGTDDGEGDDVIKEDMSTWLDLFDENVTAEAITEELTFRRKRLNERSQGQDTPLTFACWKENWDVVMALISLGADLSCRDAYGWTALMLASARGCDDVVKELLENGADVEARDKSGWTALIWASWQGHRTTIILLLGYGANMYHTSENGSTSLHYACAQGMVEAADILVINGAAMEVVDKLGHTPLLTACFHGRARVVSVLLEHHANMNIQDNTGATALHFACSRGKIGVVEVLLDRGADINSVDAKGFTPLHTSCEAAQLQIAALLVDRGAATDILDKSGFTAIHYVKLDAGKKYLEDQATLSTEIDIEGTLMNSTVYTQYKFQLSNCKLIGEIPDFIGDFVHMTALYLSRNKLEGRIPDVFSNMRVLAVLDLSSNQLSGPIPESLGCLSNLINLNLSDNLLTGPLPDSLSALVELENVNLSRNQLSGPIPEYFADFSELLKLDLSKNMFSGDLPRFLESPTFDIKLMFLADNMFNVQLRQYNCLKELFEITKGKNWLNSANWLSTLSLHEWFGLTVNSLGLVTGIRLPANRLTGSIPVSICELKSLITLDLSDNSLTGYIPKQFGNLTKLTELNLFGNVLAGVTDDDEVYYISEDLLSGYGNLQQQLLASLQSSSYVDYATWVPEFRATEIEFKLGDEWKLHLVPHVLFSCPELLSLSGYPIVLLNKKKTDLYRFLFNLCKNQNTFIFLCLQRLWHAIVMAAKALPIEEEELMLIANEVETIMVNIFHCNFMDNKEMMFRLLLPHSSLIVDQSKRLVNTWGNRAFVEAALTLYGDEFLSGCVKSRLKLVFGSAHISNLLDAVFWGHLTKALRNRKMFGLSHRSWLLRLLGRSPVLMRSIGVLSESKNQTVRLWTRLTDTTYSIFWSPRTCPAVLFFSEALMKFVLLVLVANATLYEYHATSNRITLDTIGLLIMLSCFLVYKIGIVISSKVTLWDYFETFWNAVDIFSFSLVFVWAVLFNTSYGETARIALAASAIPLTVGLLEYLSVIRSLGQLVILIVAMMYDLLNFLVIYVVFIIAFGIAFHGLYLDTIPFDTRSDSFLTLFSASLNNFTFDTFDGRDLGLRVVGQLCLLVFITLTSIVLINLLVARMSSTHSKITEKAMQEWSYTRGVTIRQYMLLSEKHPFCMLPPPLNIFPTAIFLLMKLLQFSEYNLMVVCSSCSNILFGLLGVFPRTIAVFARLVLYFAVINPLKFEFLSVIAGLLLASVVTPFVLIILLVMALYHSEDFISELKPQIRGGVKDIEYWVYAGVDIELDRASSDVRELDVGLNRIERMYRLMGALIPGASNGGGGGLNNSRTSSDSTDSNSAHSSLRTKLTNGSVHSSGSSGSIGLSALATRRLRRTRQLTASNGVVTEELKHDTEDLNDELDNLDAARRGRRKQQTIQTATPTKGLRPKSNKLVIKSDTKKSKEIVIIFSDEDVEAIFEEFYPAKKSQTGVNNSLRKEVSALSAALANQVQLTVLLAEVVDGIRTQQLKAVVDTSRIGDIAVANYCELERMFQARQSMEDGVQQVFDEVYRVSKAYSVQNKLLTAMYTKLLPETVTNNLPADNSLPSHPEAQGDYVEGAIGGNSKRTGRAMENLSDCISMADTGQMPPQLFPAVVPTRQLPELDILHRRLFPKNYGGDHSKTASLHYGSEHSDASRQISRHSSESSDIEGASNISLKSGSESTTLRRRSSNMLIATGALEKSESSRDSSRYSKQLGDLSGLNQRRQSHEIKSGSENSSNHESASANLVQNSTLDVSISQSGIGYRRFNPDTIEKLDLSTTLRRRPEAPKELMAHGLSVAESSALDISSSKHTPRAIRSPFSLHGVSSSSPNAIGLPQTSLIRPPRPIASSDQSVSERSKQPQTSRSAESASSSLSTFSANSLVSEDDLSGSISSRRKAQTLKVVVETNDPLNISGTIRRRPAPPLLVPNPNMSDNLVSPSPVQLDRIKRGVPQLLHPNPDAPARVSSSENSYFGDSSRTGLTPSPELNDSLSLSPETVNGGEIPATNRKQRSVPRLINPDPDAPPEKTSSHGVTMPPIPSHSSHSSDRDRSSNGKKQPIKQVVTALDPMDVSSSGRIRRAVESINPPLVGPPPTDLDLSKTGRRPVTSEFSEPPKKPSRVLPPSFEYRALDNSNANHKLQDRRSALDDDDEEFGTSPLELFEAGTGKYQDATIVRSAKPSDGAVLSPSDVDNSTSMRRLPVKHVVTAVSAMDASSSLKHQRLVEMLNASFWEMNYESPDISTSSSTSGRRRQLRKSGSADEFERSSHSFAPSAEIDSSRRSGSSSEEDSSRRRPRSSPGAPQGIARRISQLSDDPNLSNSSKGSSLSKASSQDLRSAAFQNAAARVGLGASGSLDISSSGLRNQVAAAMSSLGTISREQDRSFTRQGSWK